MDVIATLSLVQCFRVIGNWTLFSIVVSLVEDGAKGILGGIHFKFKLLVVIWAVEDGVAGDNEIRVSRASMQSGVHSNGTPFLSKLVSSLAM